MTRPSSPLDVHASVPAELQTGAALVGLEPSSSAGRATVSLAEEPARGSAGDIRCRGRAAAFANSLEEIARLSRRTRASMHVFSGVGPSVFLGARICEAYYKRAADKRRAIGDIFAMPNATEFLSRSAYSP